MNYMTAPAIINDHNGLVDYAKIIKLTADFFGISKETMLSQNRHREFSESRHFCMHYLHVAKHQTLVTIGRVMGGRDHTTVLYGVRNIKNLTKLQQGYKDKLFEYTSFINQNL